MTVVVCASLGVAQAQSAATVPWDATLPGLVEARAFDRALAQVEARLQAAPDDQQALFWRARLLAWSGEWAAAESTYDQLLKQSPDDVDYLVGLGSVLNASRRSAEALAVLDRAVELDDQRADTHVVRGVALRALERPDQARTAFETALKLDATSADALRGLASLQMPSRHQWSAGLDVDRFNFSTDESQVYAYDFRSRWTSDWTTVVGGKVHRRGPETAVRASGAVTRRVSPALALTAGASAGSGGGISPTGDLFVELGTGLRPDRWPVIRGVELGGQARWIWYEAATVAAFSTNVLVYLPSDWTVRTSVTIARSHFAGLGAEWHPSSNSRATFPLTDRVSGQAFVAFGTENFARRDQIGRFAAQTYGGGLRVEVSPRQAVSGYVAYQHRSEGRTQHSVGIFHVLAF